MDNENNSGIVSLSGFTFQIKVFFYYLTKLSEGNELGFEVLDDISVSSLDEKNLDNKEDAFSTRINANNEYEVSQVKRSKIDSSNYKKIIYNWLLTINKYPVKKFVLCTSETFNNEDIFFDSSENLFKKVLASNSKATALVSKVKEIYKDDYERFERDCMYIQRNFEKLDGFTVDDEINAKYGRLLLLTKDNTKVYQHRLEELFRCIQFDLLNAIGNRKPYFCDLDKFRTYIEDVIHRINIEDVELNYSVFKANTPFLLEEVRSKREYKQLAFCKDTEKFILKHIMYGLYYQKYRNLSLEANKAPRIENIENRTFESFEDVVDILKEEGRDRPLFRLDKCKNSPNNYLRNDEAKIGALIYMTREEADERQLSWKEEENE